MTATPARRIARFAAALRYEDIPAAVRERARIQMLDGLGVGFAANAYPFADKATLKDPAVLALCQRTDCASDPDTAFPAYFSGGVELELHDGRRLRRHVRVNSGAGARALSVDEASAKFAAAAGMVLSADHADRARDAILAIDERRVRETARSLGIA